MKTSAALTAPDFRVDVCAALNQALAETVVTTILAQNFHWNVTGMEFMQLHQLFQQIYEDHFIGQDSIAERIKAIDGHADGNLTRILERSNIKKDHGAPSPKEMLAAMLEAQQVMASTLKASGELAARHNHPLSEDLCIARGQVHEKFAWILQAHLR